MQVVSNAMSFVEVLLLIEHLCGGLFGSHCFGCEKMMRSAANCACFCALGAWPWSDDVRAMGCKQTKWCSEAMTRNSNAVRWRLDFTSTQRVGDSADGRRGQSLRQFFRNWPVPYNPLTSVPRPSVQLVTVEKKGVAMSQTTRLLPKPGWVRDPWLLLLPPQLHHNNNHLLITHT